MAYFILERYSEKYGLTPAVVGLPQNKRTLLPNNFKFLDGIMEIASTDQRANSLSVFARNDASANSGTILMVAKLLAKTRPLTLLA